MPFYVELPDHDGNVAYLPYAVLEGRAYPGDQVPGRPGGNPNRTLLVFSAPAEFAARHPSAPADAYAGFAEVPGPARLLTRQEYDDLIAALRR
jgi:hypothetical protein